MSRPAENLVRTRASSAATAVPDRTPEVFCVDDEAADLRIFERLLQEPGLDYPCRLFRCGEDLLEALLQVLRGAPAPVACFVDVKMTGMSGFDVLRWIRCQRPLDAIPVIMLSSADDPATLADAAACGAQCYIAKFPTATQLRELMFEAERYGAAHAGPGAFQVPFNLLRFAKPGGSASGQGSAWSTPIAGTG